MREIAREVAVPNLTPAEMDDIERIVFYPSHPQPSDVMIVFGATDGDWLLPARLFHQKMAPIILATGKGPIDIPHPEMTQAEEIASVLLQEGVPAGSVLKEENSVNTRENVEFSAKMLADRGMYPRSILFVCKGYHSGRCYLTLKKYFPQAHISAATYNRMYQGVYVDQTTWRDTPRAAARVYGEYQRILTYSTRGDIALPE
jgi:uncharacterized SAM-binding protein YcdF (DUF218 family)